MTQTKAVLKRFLKGFVAGGLAQAILIINGGLTVHSIEDLKSIGFTLLSGFLVGGLLALEKMLSWQDAPQQ
jgi:hypothetical protein